VARRGGGTAVGCLFLAVVVVVALGVGTLLVLQRRNLADPLPGQQRCVAKAGGASTVLTLEQAALTSIIVGLSVRRGLPPRAASIAMATVYQETGIRNLDGGDRDSVGLFQQRPSQGWGTPAQLQDPYYATNRFYDALVKIDGWETGDINDVAQQVQRSGFPEAYRDHESDARVLASTLTGHSPAAFSCLDKQQEAGDAARLQRSLRKTFGAMSATRKDGVLTIRARTTTLAWAYAHFAVANSSTLAVIRVEAFGRTWRTSDTALPRWSAEDPGARQRVVRITVR
jgi:hypothetical protein